METIKKTTIEIIVKKLMSFYALNRQEFAEKYRVDPSQVTRWLNDGQVPNGEVYLRLHMEYDKIKDEEPPLLKMGS